MGRVYKQSFVDKKTDISQYWIIIARRKYSILLLLVLATLLAGIVVFSITPVYKATATLLIEPEQAKLTSVEDLYGLANKDQQYYLTQLELLKSRKLAEGVIAQFGLEDKPEFRPSLKPSYNPLDWLREKMSSKSARIGKDRTRDIVVTAFEQRLSVSLVKGTQIVKVGFESESPVLAMTVANALADAYIKEKVLSRVTLTKQATGWLEKRLKLMKVNLQTSERALQDYMETNNLVDVQGVSTLTANELQELVLKVVNAKAKYSELRKRYGYMHPKIIVARSELKAAERELERGKEQIQRIGRKGVKLRELKREVQSNRELFNTFLSRLKEATEAVELHTVNARVSDPAVEPLDPVKPNKPLILTVVFLGTLMLSILMIFLLEALDRTIKGSDDVKDKIGLPLLGTLPKIKPVSGHHGESHVLAMLDPNNATYAEHVRSIRTSLILYGLDNPCKVILVSSSVAGEGKTTVSTNLAAAMGKMEKVLLIVAVLRGSDEMRAPGISGNQAGMSDLLMKKAELNECIYHLEDGGFDLIAFGRSVARPLELLSSVAMPELLEDLAAEYDRIIIDSPPLQVVSDSLMLSRYASAVVYVIEEGVTIERTINSGIGHLQDNKAQMAGVILNKVHDDVS